MGSRKSSSKKKSSKKKRPKFSSKIRKRKSRRNKSKKLSSSEDDTSSSDYSSSPQSSSSTSSEDDYSRKSRRRSRDVKRVKKRTRRRSSSRDVSEGSPPVKKRKRSNRKSLKLQKKKKRRRYASVSSRSSESRSCSSCERDNTIGSRRSDSRSRSPCQDGTTTGSEDNDLQNNRIKSRRKTEEERNPDEPSDEKRNGSRGPRCPSCNYHACSCNTTQIGNEYAEEHNPKRLRSVIIVPEKTHETEEDGTYMLKEEILNKHHDCPSWRNNDVEYKQKLSSYSCFSSNQTMQVDNLVVDDTFPLDNETFGPTKVGGGIDFHSNKVNEVSPDEGGHSGISDNIANSGIQDLETVLRKKALENLQKFRKKAQTSLKSGAKEKKNGRDVNRLSSSTIEVVPHKSSEQENKEGLALKNKVIGHSSTPVINKEFSHSTKIEINTPVDGNNGKRSGCIKQCVMQPADRSTLSESPEKEDHTTGSILLDEPQPGKLSCSTTVQRYKKENLLPSKRSIIKTAAPVRSGVHTSGTSVDLDIGAVDVSIPPTVETTSSVKSTSEGNTSKPQPDETKDGSEFEQKTMSVMRGGEMVQVSYKVYIPKRAATLARRQLKR